MMSATGTGGMNNAAQVASAGRLLLIAVIAVWVGSLFVGFRPALAACAVLGVISVAWGFTRPGLGLIGICMLVTIDAPTRVFLMTGGLLRWNSLNYWLVFVALASLPLLIKLRNPHTKILTGLAVVLAVWLPLSAAPQAGLLHLLNLVAAFGLLAYCLRAVGDATAWLWAARISGVLGALGGFSGYHLHAFAEMDRNAWAYFPLGALAIIAIASLLPIRSRKPIDLICLAAVNVSWVFLSGSRGTFLVALVFCGLLVFTSRDVLAYGVATLVVVAVITQATPTFRDLRNTAAARSVKVVDTNLSLSSRSSLRSVLALAGWRMFLENPAGLGTGSFSLEIARPERVSTLPDHLRPGLQAHSAWVKVFVENGLLGGLVLAGWVLSFAVAGWRSEHRSHLLLGLTTTGALAVGFLFTEFQPKVLWLVAGAATALLGNRVMLGGAHSLPQGQAGRSPKTAGGTRE